MDEENKKPNEEERATDFDFLQEKIKERPINKKNLIRKTILTASMAVLFGILACLSFLLLEPVINNWLYPEEEPGIVTFPQEQNEMLPEDMLTEDTTLSLTEAGSSSQEKPQSTYSTIQPVKDSDAVSDGTSSDDSDLADDGAEEEYDDPNEDEINEVAMSQPIASYVNQYDELYKVYKEVSTSMVTVIGVRSDVDWFNNTYESEGTTAGVIIANNNKELLILSRKSPLDGAQTINISFSDGKGAQAEIKQYDKSTDIAVLAVDLKNIDESTLGNVTVATLGSSSSSSITGTPIIAVGNIYGYNDGVAYGIVTSIGNSVALPDSDYKLMTTDIYASANPTGILVNMNKEVIGIIDNRYNKDETQNLLSAIGITQLKGMITNLSNDEPVPYLGIYVQDISKQIRDELGLPAGAYIYDMDKNSVAIQNGIQKGDIIVRIGSTQINNSDDYMNALRNVTIDKNIKIVIKRASINDYQEMEFTLMPTGN